MTVSEDAVSVIESRLAALCESPSQRLHGETDMAIEMALVCGAITSEERNHYVQRRDKIIEREHQQWLEQNRRL